ncbi:MAG: tRNA (adenosine(37)-N6)-threonylcarbamoyltransferase complex transferase subunit TsaD [Phycisphaerales bacterium]|nr:tRNA (adenosine(37)-N6)-threonylcarbamoyltransferase complex transferase subunit TsaD [Phycisphaerales bacterium]
MITAPRTSGTLVLGVETSCDETAAAVVTDRLEVRSSIVASQHDLHAEYGGVVPEIASRAHLQRILPTVRKAVAEAEISLGDLDAVAVGHRPGLIGSLLVGTSLGKALAYALGIPVIGVDHVHAHLVSGLLDSTEPPFPAVGLVVSGGHTSLYRLDGPLAVERLGRTIDDAVGEAFDKVGSILGLPHPGGPAVDQLARTGDAKAETFPIANLGRESMDFSFSGLKTAVLYAANGPPGRPDGRGTRKPPPPPLDDHRKANLAASFQHAAITAILRNLRKAIELVKPRTLLVGGGVTANSALRSVLESEAEDRGLELRLPPSGYCLDNGAMIAGLGSLRFAAGEHDDWTLAPAATSRTAERGS